MSRKPEDLTAQTFLTAFKSFDNLRKEEHFSSWLFTIARHKAMDHFRSRKTLSTFQEGMISSEKATPYPVRSTWNR